jgi:hypothetical protein
MHNVIAEAGRSSGSACAAEHEPLGYCRQVSATRPQPRYWFWSHDIQPDQIADLAMPGMRLQRLVNYRRGAEAERRFAALYYDDEGAIAPSRTWLVDVDADTAVARAAQAVSVSVDVAPGSQEVRFTLILDAQANPVRTLHTELDAATLAALLDGDHAVLDLATYQRDEKRCYAAIIEPRIGHSSMFFPELSRDQVRHTLRPVGMMATRARAYHTPVGWRLAVVGERAIGTAWSVHADVDGDDVAQRLEQQHGYPLDLDAVGHGLSVRFAVIAAS